MTPDPLPVALPELPEPAAHMYPSDLERFQSKETFAQAFSVAVGNPDERSVPLFTLSDMVAHAEAALRAQAEEVAALRADAERYRWLRVHSNDVSCWDGGEVLRAADLDTAIDSYMRGQS